MFRSITVKSWNQEVLYSMGLHSVNNVSAYDITTVYMYVYVTCTISVSFNAVEPCYKEFR